MEGKRSGAMLLAVIGAKLSEGLNFADDLARGVVIVGLPFANLGSPELRERMKYVKNLEVQRGISPKEKGQKDAAAELYENMCMNAVNQSIGEQIIPYGFFSFDIDLFVMNKDEQSGIEVIGPLFSSWIEGIRLHPSLTNFLGG